MIAVAHLVWGPLGQAPLREFVASYRRYEAGAEHELVVLLNNVAESERAGVKAILQSVEHRVIEVPEPMLDLAAYAYAARALEHEYVCFMNSYSVILAERWLHHLQAAAELPGVGLVGATGTWESRARFVLEDGGPEHWAYQLVKRRQRRREYAPFPNPHVRTTAFMLQRAVLLEMGLERVHDKESAYRLESGREGITQQVIARGMRPVVVGRDGRAFEIPAWPDSATYRSGDQRNLLVSDNRTREWQQAPAARARRLARRAWGRSHTWRR